MKIKSFRLREKDDMNWKVVDLNEEYCIFYSADNSTGKTTLMRSLLYAFGFSIPNTELVKFQNYEFQLDVIKDKEYIIYRKEDYLRINDIEYDLPSDQMMALACIFGTNNPEILFNILGTIYFDQEKGWTLLNRGTIIGANRFNVEKFFRGLKGDESIESYKIDEEINAIDKKISQYNLMINIGEYQNTLRKSSNSSLDYEPFDKSIELKLSDLKFQLSELEEEIKHLTDIIKQNKSFTDYIVQKKIYIKNPNDNGLPIRITKDILLDYQDFEDLNKARRDMLIGKRNELKKEIANMYILQEQQTPLINLPTIDETLCYKLANIEGINSVQIVELRDNLKKKRDKLIKQQINKTKVNNPWVTKAYGIIDNYAKELQIPFDYKINIFTRNLKEKSGAILHKMVFIYKLTYISLLSEFLGYPLPIFCDSPSGREIEKSTIDAMLAILKRDFSKHQIILASIYKYSDIFPEAQIIELNKTLFNKSSIFD